MILIIVLNFKPVQVGNNMSLDVKTSHELRQQSDTLFEFNRALCWRDVQRCPATQATGQHETLTCNPSDQSM